MMSDVHVRDMAGLMMLMGRYEEALAYAQRALELHDSADGYAELSQYQIYLKDFEAARQTIMKFEALPEVDPAWSASLWTRYYAAQKDWNRARPFYEELKEAALTNEASAAFVAEVELDIEGVEAALELLELAYVRRDPWLARSHVYALEERSTDPRWLAFWEKPGLKELTELRRSHRAKQDAN